VLAAADGMVLATTVALPVVRHPAPVAKILTALAALSSGPVVGALGSPRRARLDGDLRAAGREPATFPSWRRPSAVIPPRSVTCPSAAPGTAPR
jgi:hypothetical protein